MQRLAFPPGFLWSAATSAHQVEGGNDNSDWWDFELEPGRIKGGERSGRACDHWHRIDEDIALLKELGLNHYRFSIEWARVERRSGAFDAEAIAHYRSVLERLRAAKIEPLVTLHHFTLPRWVAARGGWGDPETAGAFARYAARVYAELGELARDWITINEPMVLLVAGYVSADFPPARTDPRAIGAPLVGLVRGHAEAYHALHAIAKARGWGLRVGLAHHLRVFDPARAWHAGDLLTASVLERAFNWALPDALATGQLRLSLPLVVRVQESIPRAKGTQDFFGVNYYSRDRIRFAPTHPQRFERVDLPGEWRSDLGWEIYPRGLYRLLHKVARRDRSLPILITENGVADASDASRARFIEEHLRFVHQAMREGVRVEAYSHWSLLDNFEWAEGFTPRFGLCAVDYATLARTVRPSARVYARIASENALMS
jgi:beta-glucosidase